ncbi:BON domain-containing protein [Phenylobacterium sp.]|uniref:BON domain-containing protein n=1 Tax=Phenylobacterium sp. TaxID=1871053 RepID=UPI00398379C1
MPRDDWRDRQSDRNLDRDADQRGRDDFGQADFSNDYGYDPRTRTGYRAERDATPRGAGLGPADYPNDGAYDPERGQAARREPPPRSWMDRASGFFGGPPGPERLDDDRRADEARRTQRRGPSDRVLWAVIAERLRDARRLDLRDIEVIVENGEVTLNGGVHRKEDKRRIEDIADIEGVRHVQNNLRVREPRGWTFL